MQIMNEENKLESYKLARRVNMQMAKMITAFDVISDKMDYNLTNV